MQNRTISALVGFLFKKKKICKKKILSKTLLISVACSLSLCMLSCSTIDKTQKVKSESQTADKALENDILVRGIRIYGFGEPTSPPVMFVSQTITTANNDYSTGRAITISCDISSTNLPNLALKLIHCDRNWKPTNNAFIQDEARLQTSDFKIELAPIGIKRYDYTAEISFPSRTSLIKIEHSGNYIARITDYYNREKILAECRFFVVEDKAKLNMFSQSTFFESGQTNRVQHGLAITAEVLPDYSIFGNYIKSVVLYESGKWLLPTVADEYAREFEAGKIFTRWNAIFSSRILAEFANIPAGNEHRLLDLTDINLFPDFGSMPTSTPLSDLPRSGNTVYADNNGNFISRPLRTNEEDYLPFEFKLDLRGGVVMQDICVVGTFNNWIPDEKSRMFYDDKTGFYKSVNLLKRGIHEYEYVAGKWDYDKNILTNYEATLLEGNSRNTTKLFYGFAYYQDPSLGGFDRIIAYSSHYTGSR